MEGDADADGATPERLPPPVQGDYWIRPAWAAVDRRLAPPRGNVGIGSIIVRSFDLFVGHFPVFLVFAMPSTVAGVLLSLLSLDGSRSPEPTPAPTFALSIVVSVVAVVFNVAMTFATDDARAGRRLELGALVRRAGGRTVAELVSIIAEVLVILGIVIGGAIAIAILAVTGFAPLVVAGTFVALAGIVYIFLRWSLSTPAVALEQLGPIEALARSRAVTKGNLWRLLALFLLLAIVGAPLEIGTGLTSITETNAGLTILLNVVASLLIAPFGCVAVAMAFGDLTGRPDVLEAPRSRGLLAAVVGLILLIGVLVTAHALPRVGSAIERLAVPPIPVAEAGRIVAGTLPNPFDACRPMSVTTTFARSEPIFVGGYFSKPVPLGAATTLDVFVNGQLSYSRPLDDVLRSNVCYHELDPFEDPVPGSYRLVVSLDGETIAEGEFTVR